MRLLKRLELVGFKSFAQKTTLDFPGGITAIVGPNGSGKSNIIDAIRWLLGEREAKNIRGAKAEDLIFAGTPQKPRMGMAQASIVFDNAGKFFPVDYTEVIVKRQVARDGISKYFLNEAEVRLKDIIDFFAKARLGTKGLTIVNQGNSDLFVKASPKDRRVMVEEVLGLRQYQIKKHDAERKLEHTRINLEKVAAMIDEIRPHLRLLKRQTVKWEKQAELEKERTELEEKFFGQKLFELEKDAVALEPKLEELEIQLAAKAKELKSSQENLQKTEKAAPQGDSDFNEFKNRQNELLKRRSTLQNMLGRVEAQMEFLSARAGGEVEGAAAVKMLEDSRDTLEALLEEEDAEEIHRLITHLLEQINEILEGGGRLARHSLDAGGEEKNPEAELAQNKKEITAELSKIDKELAELGGRETRLAGSLREFNAIFRKAFEAVEAKKDELNKIHDSKNRLLFERERVEIRRQELENLARQGERKLSEFRAKELPGGEKIGEAERRLFRARAELAGIGEVDQTLIKEARETENRFNFLSTQKDDLEKAVADLNNLIKDLDKKIHGEFSKALKDINEQFDHYFKMMFGGGKAAMRLEKPEKPAAELAPEEVGMEAAPADFDEAHASDHGGIEISIGIPRKKISGLDMLSGGEKSLVSIAALFAFISVSPPPFLVLDEVDAPLDERNARRFSELVKDFARKSQFVLVTHNRATMEAADILYGVTMSDDGTSRILSLKLESEEAVKI